MLNLLSDVPWFPFIRGWWYLVSVPNLSFRGSPGCKSLLCFYVWPCSSYLTFSCCSGQSSYWKERMGSQVGRCCKAKGPQWDSGMGQVSPQGHFPGAQGWLGLRVMKMRCWRRTCAVLGEKRFCTQRCGPIRVLSFLCSSKRISLIDLRGHNYIIISNGSI